MAGTPRPRSPKGLIGDRTPTFRWTAATAAKTYEVQVFKGSRLVVKKTGIARLSWTCGKALPRGVDLTWKVQARNAAGTGAWSVKLRFKVS